MGVVIGVRGCILVTVYELAMHHAVVGVAHDDLAGMPVGREPIRRAPCFIKGLQLIGSSWLGSVISQAPCLFRSTRIVRVLIAGAPVVASREARRSSAAGRSTSGSPRVARLPGEGGRLWRAAEGPEETSVATLLGCSSREPGRHRART